MKNLEYVSRFLSKKYNIKESEGERITSFLFKRVLENMRKSEYDGIYILNLGTFHIDNFLLEKYLRQLIYKMRNLKKKTSNKYLIMYNNYAEEFRRLWKIRKRIQNNK